MRHHIRNGLIALGLLGAITASIAHAVISQQERVVFLQGLDLRTGTTLTHPSGATLILHGLTFSSTELGALDGVTLGATLDSKVWTSSATGKTTLSAADTLNLGTGVWQIGSVSVTPTAAELAYVDISTLGTSENSKAATYSATGKHTLASADTIHVASGGVLNLATGAVLSINSVAVTPTAAQLNYCAVTTLGTSEDSKVLTMSATDKLIIADGDSITYASGAVETIQSGATFDHQSGAILKLHGLTISSTEAGYFDGVTAGTSTASKNLVGGVTKNLDTLRLAYADLTQLWIGTAQVTSTADELNTCDITTPGSSQNSKVATFDADGMLTILDGDSIQMASGAVATWASGSTLDHQSGATLKLHGLTIDATEIGYLDGVTAGTASPSKAAVLGATRNLDSLRVTAALIVSGTTTAAAVTASGLITADSLIVYDFAALAVIETAVDTTSMPGVAATDVALAFPNDTLFTGILARCITGGIEIRVADAGTGTKKMNVVAIRPK